jgi:hypothetical protein
LEMDTAVGRVMETRDAVENRRLTSAVGADQTVDLSVLKREGHAIDSPQAAKMNGNRLHRQMAHDAPPLLHGA